MYPRAIIACVVFVLACDIRTETTVSRTEPYDEDLPAAEGAPAAFDVDAGIDDAERRDVGQCPLRLVDRSGQVDLRLSRSRVSSTRSGDTVTYRGYGDYLIQPVGTYGVDAGERLRVDCARNVPIGVVSE